MVAPTAIGVNYMDIGARETGMGGWGAPVTLGVEGAGRVVAVGTGWTTSPWATAWPGTTCR
ncbi:alcohol dehydrogenase catalytic domain-containing protein [Kutzneria kofuensis]|uniref:alcohol dehydrogenase catalytic domain-containing protein n=1 Tax=Kutzneria kofuensis TaxID=103725 RepID=UPI0031ED102E